MHTSLTAAAVGAVPADVIGFASAAALRWVLAGCPPVFRAAPRLSAPDAAYPTQHSTGLTMQSLHCKLVEWVRAVGCVQLRHAVSCRLRKGAAFTIEVLTFVDMAME